MNDSPAKFAVIQSRLPYIDRRALSQAWFSALHLAEDAPATRGRANAPNPASVPAPCAAGGGAATSAPLAASVALRSSAAVRRAVPDAASAAPVCTPARASGARVASAARRSVAPPRIVAPLRASFSFGAAGERVHVLLRRDGAILHVIAVCRPAVAETVARALASASAGLRANGDALRARVHAFDTTAVRA